jgi:hypothetical protein
MYRPPMEAAWIEMNFVVLMAPIMMVMMTMLLLILLLKRTLSQQILQQKMQCPQLSLEMKVMMEV